MKKPGSGKIQKKILLLLLGGAALAFSSSPRRMHHIFSLIAKEWHMIDKRSMHEAIKKLYASRLVRMKKNSDGTLTLVLTDAGKERALTYHAESMKISPQKRWDRKWRIIFFDIPEGMKLIRDALRRTLKQIGMIEYQKSVFIHPFPCNDEIDFLIELYDVRPYVRFIVAEFIDNNLHIRRTFEQKGIL